MLRSGGPTAFWGAREGPPAKKEKNKSTKGLLANRMGERLTRS